jgi:hypothetical protein
MKNQWFEPDAFTFCYFYAGGISIHELADQYGLKIKSVAAMVSYFRKSMPWGNTIPYRTTDI